MKKFTTKTLLALACVAVAGMQTAGAADMLTTHAGDVLSGASIHSHTAGLSSVVPNGKSATLNFTDHTRIDWSKLNVAKDETLNFKNGNFAVLNNVLGKSITKVAGKITGENGKIIISNPNGILFQGGKFETAGAAILTTKDLTSYAADQIAGLDADAIKNLANNENFNVVALVDGSSIKAGGDINIIANGVEVFNGELLTNDGDILVTADGANYVKGTKNNVVTMKADDGTSTDVKFNSLADDNRENGKVYAPVLFANSTVKTEDGDIKIVSGDSVFAARGGEFSANNVDIKAETGNIYLNTAGNAGFKVNGNLNADAAIRTWVKNTEVNGDTNLSATHVTASNSTFNGNLDVVDTEKDYAKNINNTTYLSDLTVTGDRLTVNAGKTGDQVDPVFMDNINAPNTNVEVNARLARLNNVNLGDTKMDTYGYSVVENGSVINGNLDIKTNSASNTGTVHLGGYDTIVDADGNSTRGNLREGEKVTIKGDLTVDSGSTIGIGGKVTVDGKADLTTHHSSVVYPTSSNDNIDVGIDAKKGLTINAPESLNELLPLDGDLNVTTTLKNGNDEGLTVTASRYFEEMQRDYVQTREPGPDPKPDPDPINPDIPDDDVSKILDNLVLNGVDTANAQTFTPIAFAADEDQDLVKRIAKTVFKTPDNIVSISERLIQKDINGSF